MDPLVNISQSVNLTRSWLETFPNTTGHAFFNWNTSSSGINLSENDTSITDIGSNISAIINAVTSSVASIGNDIDTAILWDKICLNNSRSLFVNDTAFTQNGTEFDTSIAYDSNCTNGNKDNKGNNKVKDDDEDDFPGLISDSALDIINLIDYVVLSGTVCFLGIIFNMINAIIFYRMGFGDTVNIMLFSLAITDLGALIPLLWKAVLFNPWFHDWDAVDFDYMTFQHYTGGWPHACFANISCLIIGLVTLDRCLCIAMPLKVRSIITPRRTVIIITIFFVVLISSLIPLSCTVHFGPVFFDDKNKTFISMVSSEEVTYVENLTLSFYTVNQLVALVGVILFTTILVVQLKKKSAWRMKTSSARNSNSNIAGRDTKIVKMVLFISVVYIICYVPGAVNIVIMIFIQEYSYTGRYKNICTLVWAKSNFLEAFNSAINIFVYLKMSSKYKQVFNKLFRRNSVEGGKNLNSSRSERSAGNSVSAVKQNATRMTSSWVSDSKNNLGRCKNENSSVSKTKNGSRHNNNGNCTVSTIQSGLENPDTVPQSSS